MTEESTAPRRTKQQARRDKRGTKFGPKRKKLDVGKDVWSAHSEVRVGVAGAELFTNPDSVKEWDMEELMRGQRRAKNGKFVGQPPAVIPQIVYRELVRRQLSAAQEEMIDNLGLAVERLVAIATAPSGYDAKDQLTAIKMVMDRVMGTAPQTVAVTNAENAKPWAQALVKAIVDVPDGVREDVIDVEEVED